MQNALSTGAFSAISFRLNSLPAFLAPQESAPAACGGRFLRGSVSAAGLVDFAFVGVASFSWSWPYSLEKGLYRGLAI